MKWTRTLLAMALVLGFAGVATAQPPAPRPIPPTLKPRSRLGTKPAPGSGTVVSIGTRWDGQETTRVLRLTYRLRILVLYSSLGAHVHTVFPGGPATRLRSVTTGKPGTLERGDVITHIDDRPVPTQSDYYLAMWLSAPRNGKIRLRVRDVNSGRIFHWDAVAERADGVSPDAPVRKDSARASRVKALLIGDTLDRRIGEGVSANLQNLQRYLEGLPGFDPKTDLKVLAGRNVTARNILAEAASLRVGPTETLFCYISCHGAHDRRFAAGDPSGGHFFQLPGGHLMRRDLLGQLRGKDAQLTVLLSDTCNVPGLYIPPTMKGPMAPPPIRSKAFEDLLFNQIGVVDVSGSSAGQYGWFQSDGGWFTLGLIRSIAAWDKGGAKVSADDPFKDPFGRKVGTASEAEWKPFLEQTSRIASELFQTRKKFILAAPEPKEAGQRETRQKLREQSDQRPQAFQLNVFHVKR